MLREHYYYNYYFCLPKQKLLDIVQVLGDFLGIEVGEGEEAKSQIHLHLSLSPCKRGGDHTIQSFGIFLVLILSYFYVAHKTDTVSRML